MLVKNPKYHKRLSNIQVQLLLALFKFRFVSTDLVAEVLKKHRSTIYEGLYNLEKQGLVHKFHDKTYRRRGRPAIYCLAAGGIKYLRNNTDLDQITLKNFYKNKRMVLEAEEQAQEAASTYTTAPASIADKHLLVAQLFNRLKALTGNTFHIYTKYELNRDSWPKPPPELFLQRANRKSKKPDYALDIFSAGTFGWLLKKRLQAHQEFAEDYNYRYPDVLLVAGNMSTEKRLFEQTYFAMQDFSFYVTRQELLLDDNDGKIWTDVEESEEDEWVRVGL